MPTHTHLFLEALEDLTLLSSSATAAVVPISPPTTSVPYSDAYTSAANSASTGEGYQSPSDNYNSYPKANPSPSPSVGPVVSASSSNFLHSSANGFVNGIPLVAGLFLESVKMTFAEGPSSIPGTPEPSLGPPVSITTVFPLPTGPVAESEPLIQARLDEPTILDGWVDGLPPPQVELVPLADKDLAIVAAYLVGSPASGRSRNSAPVKGPDLDLTDFIVGSAGSRFDLLNPPLAQTSSSKGARPTEPRKVPGSVDNRAPANVPTPLMASQQQRLVEDQSTPVPFRELSDERAAHPTNPLLLPVWKHPSPNPEDDPAEANPAHGGEGTGGDGLDDSEG